MPTLAALAVIATAIALGNWQMRRADQKASIHAQREAAERTAPIDIASQRPEPSSLDGRRVRVRGTFVADRTVFIDNRTRKGVAGFHVATPLRIDGARDHVLVLRGWVASDPANRSRVPLVFTPAGTVDVAGFAHTGLDQVLELKASPPPAAGDVIWQNLDFERYRQWSGLALYPIVVRQSAAPAWDDALARDWPAPGSDVDKHLGYALQWYALAAIATGGWLYFSLARRRHGTRADS